MKASLQETVKVTRVLNDVAAGTSNQTSSSVDMSGFESVRFIALLGALTAGQVTKMKLQQSDDNSSFTDVTGGETAAMADADGNKTLVIDVVRPTHRYYQVIVERGTANAVIDGVIAEQYYAKSLPVAQPAATQSQTLTLLNP